ncbi:hypothetical protein DPMN_092720 [Dreissena polymorpha]|uniref:B box-type domain-containing protein n=1 Tax=Dreissena polymorpha TaxID=45954 RepID=A0A9D4L2B7_DREPO|nr:hypothetical protein DPMN_092720 [Dreissena polymorpha]
MAENKLTLKENNESLDFIKDRNAEDQTNQNGGQLNLHPADEFTDNEGRQLLCQSCEEYGYKYQAEGFCVTCSEFLCRRCFEIHTLPRPMRGHVLEDKDQMPKDYTRKRKVNVELEMCPFHKNEIFISFCKKHDQLCCQMCVDIAHGICDLITIDAACADQNQKARDFVTSIVELHRKYVNLKFLAEEHISEIQWYYDKAILSLKKTIDVMHTRDIQSMTNIVRVCEKAVKQLNGYVSEVDTFKKNAEHSREFIAMKLLGNQMQIIKNNLNHLEEKNHYTRYSFYGTNNALNIGSLVIVSGLKEQIKTSNYYSGVKRIDCLVVLSDLRLIAMIKTQTNNNLTLINVSFKSKLHSEPFPLSGNAIVERMKDYVFVKNGEQIHTCKASEISESKKTYRKTDFRLDILVTNGATLLALCCDPLQIIELDEVHPSVKVSKKTLLTVDGASANLFRHQASVAFTTTEILYATDSETNSVFKIAKEGESHCLVRSDRLASPTGIALYREDTMLVCCTSAKCIVRVTTDGKILSFIETCDFEPGAVAFDEAQSLLYVSGKGRYINVYHA